MIIRAGVAATVFCLSAVPAFAADVAMVRVQTCRGPDAAMEIYVPESAVLDGVVLPRPVTGAYALDLSGALKGKHLEAVHVGFSPDKKFLIVEQFTRGLPATRIPVGGGIVDFDNRFGTKAKCGPLGVQ